MTGAVTQRVDNTRSSTHFGKPDNENDSQIGAFTAPLRSTWKQGISRYVLRLRTSVSTLHAVADLTCWR